MRVLQGYARSKGFLENVLENEIARVPLSALNRRLVQELTFGVVRWQATLDWLIANKTDGRPQKAGLQALLRVGLYQIFWLDRIPDHAVVHEAVELAKHLGFGAQAGFVNALLRGYLRERESTIGRLKDLQAHRFALGYSHPDWLVERWQKRWTPDALRRLLEWNNVPPPTYARMNALRTNAPDLARQWEQEGVAFVPCQWDWTGEGLVFELKTHPALVALPSFQQGAFYVQDPSTLLAVIELGPRPGERILDLCAAPGGKTTFIAQRMGNQGSIHAMDSQRERRQMVFANCQRLGVTCVRLALAEKPTAAQSAMPYDRVLLDVPCSNTGVMRRRVDLRWRLRPEEILRLRTQQIGLLGEAAERVAPGGTLVYSTCSLEPEENQEVTREFVSRNPEFGLENERELFPFADGVDGAYVARFVRR